MANEKKKGFSIGKLLLCLLIVVLAVFLITTVFGGKGGGNTAANEPEERGYSDYYTTVSSGYAGNWKLGSNVGSLNSTVASGVRAKRTQILGNNRDVITIMVFMCGSDLESKNSMGVMDLQEMARATLDDERLNLIVYTGGCTRWHTNNLISSTYNQIYRVHSGGVEPLVENAGTGSMVDPDTLVSFIEWTEENYPANRYELIMWDHGSGSVGGYGYDEKYPNKGSMGLDKLDAALTEADVQFDFIGFDACLMGNTETALMLAEHGDYLIASEESEPGIGWYYTDWLNALSKNTSMPTLEIGKNIADSFVSTCKSQTRGQSATLAVIDLAEMSHTVPGKLSAFSKSTTNLINNNNFRTVAQARAGSREFAPSSGADLVDLVDMASAMGTGEANELVKSLLSCIKYNNTTSDMYNAYGLSIYFPYRSGKYVNTMLNVYNNIDMNADYSNCIRSFATYANAGQVSSGGTHNAYQSYNSYNSSDYYSSQSSADLIFSLLEMFAGGGYSSQPSYSSYYGSVLDLLFRDGVDRNMAEYIAENHFDADLTFKDGKIPLTDKQWSMIEAIRLNVFIDDGKGYIDLGKDNVFDVDENGSLLKAKEVTWLAASADQQNWQVIPYYLLTQIDETDDTISYGRVPVLYNDSPADLILKLNDEGVTVIGITYDYEDGVDVIAKSLTELVEGDTLEFVADYYDYDGNFVNNYVLGDKLTVKDQLHIGDVSIADYKSIETYEIKDIYQQSYWTTPAE